MREHSINSLDNFIAGWYLQDTTICDKIIDFFNASNKKHQGITGKRINSSFESYIDTSIKDSIDCPLEDEILLKYSKELQTVVNQYIKKYPYCNNYSPWGIRDSVNIQYYPANGGYHIWHTERASSNPSIVSSRHLTFITYLNTVKDKGETEFFHQKISVKPEKGLTIIWPVDWTFTHRGVASPTEEKYIVTGWFNYV